MRNLAPKIILPAWGIWFACQLFRLAADTRWMRPQSGASAYGFAIGFAFGGPVLVGIAAWLAWRLFQEPRRRTMIWFIVLCVFLSWKFWIGEIVIYMHPSLGGLKFGEAVAKWWARSTADLGTACASLLPPLLTVVSIGYWPVYCRSRKQETSDHAA